MKTELTVFSMKTLRAMKEDLMVYVRDVSKNIACPDVRIMVNGCLADLDTIDNAIKELGGDDASNSNRYLNLKPQVL